DLPYRDLDVAHGVHHLQLMGVRYYMVLTPEAKAQAAANPDLRFLASSGPWSVNYDAGTQQRTWDIYEVRDSDVVTGLRDEPVVMKGVSGAQRSWLKIAIDWYQDENRWDVPLAVTGPASWPRVTGAPGASA